ncbi:hypothetical protein EDB85DRAFT_115599 [Lactarius pseudohatsudake]|nr:hypothetical protein EDB85DRAFT_115599 [Lactarius pseudohatsudake]
MRSLGPCVYVDSMKGGAPLPEGQKQRLRAFAQLLSFIRGHSGLHLVRVRRVLLYFPPFFGLASPLLARSSTRDALRVVCVSSRPRRPEKGQRRFRLSSFGILLAPRRSLHPRPRRYVHAPCAQAPFRSCWQDHTSLRRGSSSCARHIAQ